MFNVRIKYYELVLYFYVFYVDEPNGIPFNWNELAVQMYAYLNPLRRVAF